MANVVTGLENPELWASLAAFVTAIAALFKLFQIQAGQAVQHETLRAVQKQTDGQLTALHADVRELAAKQATPQEIAARPDAPVEVPPQA